MPCDNLIYYNYDNEYIFKNLILHKDKKNKHL